MSSSKERIKQILKIQNPKIVKKPIQIKITPKVSGAMQMEQKIRYQFTGRFPSEKDLNLQLSILQNKIKKQSENCGIIDDSIESLITCIFFKIDNKDHNQFNVAKYLMNLFTHDVYKLNNCLNDKQKILAYLTTFIHINSSGLDSVKIGANGVIEYTAKFIPDISKNEKITEAELSNMCEIYKTNKKCFENLFTNDQIFANSRIDVIFCFKYTKSFMRWILTSLRLTNVIGFLMQNCNKDFIMETINSSIFVKKWLWRKDEFIFNMNYDLLDKDKTKFERIFIAEFLTSIHGNIIGSHIDTAQEFFDLDLNS
jgi:hypothetical protein